MTLLDLSKHFNAKLDEDTPRFPDNHWRDLPRGEQTFAGVKFRVGDGVIQLRGGPYWRDCPERVEIPVGKRLSNLYLLHATHDIVYKRHVADGWLRWKPQPLPQAAFAWVGDNPAASAANYRLSLYATRLVNPYPEKEVEAIVYESASHPKCDPFCVAMTIEQSAGSGTAASRRGEPHSSSARMR